MKKGKIMMKSSSTVADTFSDFLLHCKAKGLSEKTLATYSQHFSAISKHLDSSVYIEGLIKSDLENMIASMRDAGLSPKEHSVPIISTSRPSFAAQHRPAGLRRGRG